MKITSSTIADYHFRSLINLEIEEVWVVALNVQLAPVATEMLFRGSVESCPIHPREILRFLCIHRASYFIICHSHPSGDHGPSRKDLRFTQALKRLGELLMVPLQDHIILSKNGYCSLADRGFLKKRALSIELKNQIDWFPEN